MRAVVIVLGDLSRSPRIVLHARAIGRAGWDVELVGYADAASHATFADAGIRVWSLRDRQGSAHVRRSTLRYGATAAARGVSLLWQLARLLLWQIPRPDLILVQNPPGVPTLAIAWLAARLRSARFGIDWHNLTWTMLALRLGEGHAIVTAVKAYERLFARRSDVNLFVSAAMQQALALQWNVDGTVFRDRPASTFTPLSAADRQETRASILARVGEQQYGDAPVVVTATSWTADEDFNLLFDALVRYDAWLAGQPPTSHPARVLMLITGRGPLRSDYERRFAHASLRCIGVHTMWLDADEYPRAIAAADLGVSLHTSASGLDLPMKILDLFGAGVPVCAFEYGPCLSELVTPNVNGLLFRTSEQLTEHLRSVLEGFPNASARLQHLREGVARHRMPEWETAWTIEVRPVLMA